MSLRTPLARVANAPSPPTCWRRQKRSGASSSAHRHDFPSPLGFHRPRPCHGTIDGWSAPLVAINKRAKRILRPSKPILDSPVRFVSASYHSLLHPFSLLNPTPTSTIWISVPSTNRVLTSIMCVWAPTTYQAPTSTVRISVPNSERAPLSLYGFWCPIKIGPRQ